MSDRPSGRKTCQVSPARKRDGKHRKNSFWSINLQVYRQEGKAEVLHSNEFEKMAKRIKDFSIEVNKNEILRLLGHTSKRGNIKERSKELVEEMISFSCDLIKPEGIFVIRESRELPEECFFNAEKVALCICTIGKLLEKQVERLTNQGELTRAVILDAIGSVAAESTAEHLNQVIADEAKKKKLYGNTRFSPGYGGWKLEAQRFIFDLLPAEKIGVRLNRSFMMIPRKSVSFAINLSRNPFKDKGATPCEICGLKKCGFKKRQT